MKAVDALAPLRAVRMPKLVVIDLDPPDPPRQSVPRGPGRVIEEPQ